MRQPTIEAISWGRAEHRTVEIEAVHLNFWAVGSSWTGDMFSGTVLLHRSRLVMCEIIWGRFRLLGHMLTARHGMTWHGRTWWNEVTKSVRGGRFVPIIKLELCFAM